VVSDAAGVVSFFVLFFFFGWGPDGARADGACFCARVFHGGGVWLFVLVEVYGIIIWFSWDVGGEGWSDVRCPAGIELHEVVGVGCFLNKSMNLSLC